ncbi:MAG: Ig-like domain-containing protein [marine benthic group bacterium]|nr:Ig-like domain-containing protein [Candidatus Carthagonibacter metallireducens]
MRVGFVRKAGLGAVLIAAAALGACNDDPVSWDPNDTTDMFVNPTVMTVPAGREAKLTSRAVNPGNEPTFAAVSWAIDPTAGCVDSGVGVGTVTVTEDPDALPIQPPGLFVVTGGTSMGQTCIILTSGGVSQTVKVTTIADAILILDAPETILFGGTTQLGALLVSNTDPPETVGPFEITEATWTTDDETIATVDENGLVTGVGPGVATITACWSGSPGTGTSGLGYEVCDEAVIEVVVGAATVTGLTPATGIPGQTVTINGSGFVSVHEVFIDGFSYGNPDTENVVIVEEITPTSITIRWPNLGNGGHDVGVGIPGAVSAPVTFTQTAELEADEPANDLPGTTTTQIDVGEAWVGAFGTGEVDDWIIVDIPADGDYDFILYWTGGSGDMDFLLYDDTLTNVCFSYYSNPEADCVEQTLTAGTYYMLVEDFDAIVGNVTNTTYRLTVDATPEE